MHRIKRCSLPFYELTVDEHLCSFLRMSSSTCRGCHTERRK